MTRYAQFNKMASLERVDAAAGVIFGVSVITKGDAIGHDLKIDDETLYQILLVAKTHKDGIKVKFGKDHDAGVIDTTGTLKNFRIEGGHVRADLHLLKSDKNFAKIVEMAQSMPNEFGLSAAFSGEHEIKGAERFARCSEIYSVDMVGDPAANPNGLFSTNTNTMKDIALALGLPEKATEAEIVAAAKANAESIAQLKKSDGNADVKKLSADVEAIKTDLGKKITDATTELGALRKREGNALAIAEKKEIDALLSEASRDGKVVPFDTADLYAEKDGLVTILTKAAQLSKVISKLPKGQVRLKRQPVEAPKGKDGAQLDRTSGEFKTFCAERREAGAAELQQSFKEAGLITLN